MINVEALTFTTPTISNSVALVNYGPLTDTVYYRDSYDKEIKRAQPTEYLVTFPSGRTFRFSAAEYAAIFV